LQRIDEWAKLPEEKRIGKNKSPELFVRNEEWDAFCTKK